MARKRTRKPPQTPVDWDVLKNEILLHAATSPATQSMTLVEADRLIDIAVDLVRDRVEGQS